MKRLAALLALLALLGPAASCTLFGVFEDVANDPHPPEIVVEGIAYTPVIPEAEPTPPTGGTDGTGGTGGTGGTDGTGGTGGGTPAPAPAPVAPAPVYLPPDGFEVALNDPVKTSLMFLVRFVDAGGDCASLGIRDLESSLFVTASPAEPPALDLDGDGKPEPSTTPPVFPGTRGIIEVKDIGFSGTQLGPHRIEVWAEDTHGSRSPKATFTINVVIANR